MKALFTAPTALRAIKRDDDEGRYVRTGGAELGRKGIRGLQAIFLAGERSEPTIVTFYQRPSSCELRLMFRVVGQVECSGGDGN